MLDTPRLLMIVGGLGLAVIGIRRKDRLEIGLGLCFIGSALAGRLATSNEVYAWIQLLFVIGMVVLLVAKYRALKKKSRDGGEE
jgi:high-affinity Fe2+/Pb2+ permease